MRSRLCELLLFFFIPVFSYQAAASPGPGAMGLSAGAPPEDVLWEGNIIVADQFVARVQFILNAGSS